MHKNELFLQEIAKNRLVLGVSPPDLLASAAEGSAPRPSILHWEFLATPLLHTILLMLNIKQENC